MSKQIEEVKDYFDLIEYIGRDMTLRGVNGKATGICPFHSERTGSLSVWHDHYHCFSCGEHGDLFGYYQKVHNVSFIEALRVLAKEAGIVLQESPEAARKHQEHLERTEALGKVADFYHTLLLENAEALDYLHRRGFKDDFIASYKIGYTPGKCVRDSGVPDDDLKRYGLVNDELRDTLYRRIIFPVWGRYAEIVDLSGRTLGDAKPKYVKLPGPNSLIHECGIRGQPTVFLTEGDTDTAMLAQAKLPVVGVRGVQALSDDMVDAFKKAEAIYVVADNDTIKVNENGVEQKPPGTILIERCGALFGNRCKIITVPNIKISDDHTIKDVSDYINAGYDFKMLVDEAKPYIQWLLDRAPAKVAIDDRDTFIAGFVPILRTLGKSTRDGWVKEIAKHGPSAAAINEAIRANPDAEKDKKPDKANLLWGKGGHEVNPAQALENGLMLTTIFMDVEEFNEDLGIPEVKYYPYVVRSGNEIMPLSPLSMHNIGMRYNEDRVPGLENIFNRWRLEEEHPFGVKSYIDGKVQVNAWDVYREVVAHFRRWVWYPDDCYYDFLALWVIGTYFFDLMPAFPYVHLIGTKRSGKTLTIQIIEQLAFNVVRGDSLSAASMFRLVQANSSTLLIDEAESLFEGANKDNDANDKLSLLKAGYKRGGVAWRCGTDGDLIPKPYSIYSPKVFGGTKPIDRVLADRVITLRLERKDTGGGINPFNPNIHQNMLQETRDKLYILMLTHGQDVQTWFNEGVDFNGVSGRAMELWGPIFIVAELIDAIYVDSLNGDTPDTNNLLSVKMREMAKQNVLDRNASDSIEQNEVAILEYIIEYLDSGIAPCAGVDWYASKPILEYIQAADGFHWMKSVRHVYNELEKTLAINKTTDIAAKRPSHSLKVREKVRCIRLDRAKLVTVARRLGSRVDDDAEQPVLPLQ